MNGHRVHRGTTSALLAAVLGATVQADPILTLYSTGVDDSHVALGNHAIDPHYKLISSPDPDFPGPIARTINSSTYAIQNDYVPNTSTSRWIGPRADAGGNVPDGFCESTPTFDCDQANYVYQTTFDLTGFDPQTALITGQWAMDDSGELFLNGVSKAFRPYVFGPEASFRTWASFTIDSDFLPGLNTITIVVNNAFFPLDPDANPTALRVDMTGTASPLIDQCPDDPDKTSPGICGCGVPDTDTDNDATPDCNDACPGDPLKTAPGSCGCGLSDADSDGDGIVDCVDACPGSVPGALVDAGGCSSGRGDFDHDGDVDLSDLDTLRSCISREKVPHSGTPTCQMADYDADNDVDQTDFGLWQRCYSGSGLAAAPNCSN